MTERPGAARATSAWLETRTGLACLFALGLAIRLYLARHSAGLWFDVTLFREWSDRLVTLGPRHFYAPDYVVDYPPGYLYVLLALGKLSHLILHEGPPVAVLKLPAIGADLVLAAVAAAFANRLGRTAGAGLPLRAIGAAAVLFNPGLILDSSVWGQVDSVPAALLMAGILVLVLGRPGLWREAGGVCLLALGLAVKPQGLIGLPVLTVVLAWRHLSAGGFAASAWTGLSARVVAFTALTIGVVAATFWPFGIGLRGIPAFFHQAGTMYPVTSLWAFNLWGAVGYYRPDTGAGAVTVLGVSAFQFGVWCFLLGTAATMVWSWRALTRGVDAVAVAVFGAAVGTCLGFALLTRMHERYLYLAIAALAPFAGDRRFRRLLVVLSLLFFLNVHFVYVYFAQHSTPPEPVWTIQPLYDALFGSAQDAWQLRAWSVVTTATCLIVAVLGWGWLQRISNAPAAE